MSSIELLAARIHQLQKRPQDIEQAAETLRRNCLKSKEQFEQRFHTRLTRKQWPPGTLVLVRNMGIEKELDCKSKPRYLGPFEVVRQTKGGSYVLQELDGTIGRRGIAAFRIMPYISRYDKHLLQVVRQEEEILEHPDGESDNEESDEED